MDGFPSGGDLQELLATASSVSLTLLSLLPSGQWNGQLWAICGRARFALEVSQLENS